MKIPPFHDHEREKDTPTKSRPPGAPQALLLSVIVGPRERPACTMYPPGVAVPYRTTTWLTAYGDSFVRLDECR